MLDFHSHLIPGVDDGAETLDASHAAIAALAAQGVDTIITTPHVRASMCADPDAFSAYLGRIDTAWNVLRTMARAEFPTLRLERGVELLIDVPTPDVTDPRIRLAGTRFVLIEFPFSSIPPNSAQVLFDLKMAGYAPIVAHPERYVEVDDTLTHVVAWKRAGAYCQVNEGSLVGMYGAIPQARAWTLLRAGLADYLSSDYHARGNPAVSAARDALRRAGGADQHRLLTTINPAAILENRLPALVPPIAAARSRTEWRTGWRRWWHG